KGEQARREIAILFSKQGWKYPIDMPDISTKDKAQRFIGLNPEKMKADKEEFLKTTTVKWDEEAKQRQGFLYEYKLRD
ncbi:MAG: ammonia-forming cytochrome c nitrite reductase subunit c552, partial [Ignavibacterium sp.]